MTDIPQIPLKILGPQEWPACTAVLVDISCVKRELFTLHVPKGATFIGVAVEPGGEISIRVDHGDVKTSAGTGVIASDDRDYALDVYPVRDPEDT